MIAILADVFSKRSLSSLFYACAWLGFGAFLASSTKAESLNLEGEWSVSLGSPAPSFPMGACPQLQETQTILLPGTTETRGLGVANTQEEAGSLTRVLRFEGPAWYERLVDIPKSFAGKRVSLRLERSKYTQVWLDGKPVGEQVLYTVPQTYHLGDNLVPGPHRLTILVDNRLERRPVKAQSHQHSDDTQTNWNGIIGSIELTAHDEMHLAGLQVRPNLPEKVLKVRLRPSAPPPAGKAATVTLRASSFNHAGPTQTVPELRRSFKAEELKQGALEISYPLGEGALCWDEFSPALYKLEVRLESELGVDARQVVTGLREFSTKGTQFTINGRTTFLRGKHDACVFPLTGHPPMDVQGWLEYLRTCQDYGINHLRCHTWVPPKAAFEAADMLGIYLQPELPFWGTFDSKVKEGLMPEAEALLEEYGNHPSFVMFTLANEAGGDRVAMNSMVEHLRKLDPSRLYADGSNNVLWEPRQQPTNDFWPTAKIISPANGSQALPARGSFCVFDGNEGHVQWGPSNTREDLAKAIQGVTIPVIGHETGQWTSYPDFRQISKYTGVVRARNLERFQRILERRGMLDQAEAFAKASGALAGQLYREENELFLRTPGMGGFQLLDLQDFPGQGSALVGVLDAFMDSKGGISLQDWRKSCDSIVPLARFDRYTWTNVETYEADIELAHYGRTDLTNAHATWHITGADGVVYARGAFAKADYAQGGLRKIGRIQVPLRDALSPARYELSVELVDGHNRHTNNWPLWVYPTDIDTSIPEGVTLVRRLDSKALGALAAGGRVVLIPDSANWADTLGGAYATDYWNWPMFNGSPGTLGLLCATDSQALVGFPTKTHSERQWASIAHASTPVILAETPSSFRPIVQVIDNYERNQKLGLVFETRVGEGALLVCACDLFALKDKPEARQLLASLLDYAASPAFIPEAELAISQLKRMLSPSLVRGRPVLASSYFHPPWGAIPNPARITDGDINTKWIADDSDKNPVVTIELENSAVIQGVELWWEAEEPGYRYVIEAQTKEGAWIPLADERENPRSESRHYLAFNNTEAKALRLNITGTPEGRKASLRELRLIGE